MERKVYCIIGERYKCVKFVKENHLSDAECLRRALTKVRASDNILDNMMKGKGIVLQKAIPGKRRLCDIEEDDEICTDSDITVLLIDLNPTFEAPVAITTTSSTNTTNTDCTQNLEARDIIEMDIENIPILFEENVDAADNLASDKANVQVQANADLNSLKTSKRCHQMEKLSGPGTVSNPVPLPELTVELDDLRKRIGVLEGQKSFIYFWATHLSAITNNQPTKRDYLHYALSIVAAYPELKGGKGDCGIVKTQLSTCIRNRKANIKKRCNNISHKPVRLTFVDMASLVVDKEPTPVQIDIEDALKELQKSKDDTPHVRRLLKDTFDERRKWIQSDAKKISEVVEKYPHLKLDTLVLFEFCMMKKWKEEGAIRTFITKIDAMIKALGQHFGIITQNELDKVQIVLRLYESVTNKRERDSGRIILYFL